MYFNTLPLITYSLDNKTTQIVRDITIRTRIANYLKESAFLYDRYAVKDGEMPEHVASRFYKNPLLHWVVMITNDVIDPYNDWPISDYNFSVWANTNFTEEELNSVHHHEDQNGFWVNESAVGAHPITVYEYYYTENDKKRTIKLIKPELLQIFLDEYNRLTK